MLPPLVSGKQNKWVGGPQDADGTIGRRRLRAGTGHEAFCRQRRSWHRNMSRLKSADPSGPTPKQPALVSLPGCWPHASSDSAPWVYDCVPYRLATLAGCLPYSHSHVWRSSNRRELQRESHAWQLRRADPCGTCVWHLPARAGSDGQTAGTPAPVCTRHNSHVIRELSDVLCA
eukprot:366245-Chlamydomonas_euryale.AAC.2